MFKFVRAAPLACLSLTLHCLPWARCFHLGFPSRFVRGGAGGGIMLKAASEELRAEPTPEADTGCSSGAEVLSLSPPQS